MIRRLCALWNLPAYVERELAALSIGIKLLNRNLEALIEVLRRNK